MDIDREFAAARRRIQAQLDKATYAEALRELRSLAIGSVVLDSDGDAWQLTPSGWTCVGYDGTNSRDMDASSVAILTPIAVVHRAEHGAEVGVDWVNGLVLHEFDRDWHPMPRSADLPEHLRIELEGWGFGVTFEGRDGEHRLIANGAHLVYESEGSDYTLATSTYYGEDVGDARPFLATVLDVLRWAAGDPIPEPADRGSDDG